MSAVFCCSLAEVLRFGHVLEICGKAKEGGERFHISLATADPNYDANVSIGLHILVDIPQGQIILKKFLNTAWCDVETYEFDTAQFSREFKIYIVMADEKFHISINKQFPLSRYKYRLRLSLMHFIEISGDLEYVRQMDHRKYFPYTWPPIQVVEEQVQFSNDVPMPFQAGHVLVVTAQLTGNRKGRCNLHLRNINDIERQEFHMSIRFDTKTIVKTSKTTPVDEHYSFDEEDRDGHFPFEDFFKPFRFAFGFTQNELKIAKDGSFLGGFVFRTPRVLPCIGGLKIFGVNGVDVKVTRIDHVQMEDSFCAGFEIYSQLE